LIPEKVNETPLFAARVWSVPDRSEAANRIEVIFEGAAPIPIASA
jgi:hypothetical protein